MKDGVAVFLAQVRNGELPFEIARQVKLAIASLDEKVVKITVEHSRRKSSQSQKGYYFSVIIPILTKMYKESSGRLLEVDEIHHWAKDEIGQLWVDVQAPDGKMKRILRSLGSLDTKEMEDYMESIRAWAAEWGEVIPLPDKEWRAAPKYLNKPPTKEEDDGIEIDI